MSLRIALLLTESDLPAPAEGQIVASKVLDALRDGPIVLDFTGVSGVTTAFATVLFRCLFAQMRPDDVRAQVTFKLQSRVQREVVQRSLRAARDGV